MSKRALLLSFAACLVTGYLVACAPGFDPVNPFAPKKPDRPIARLLARMAKLGLWVMVFAEPAHNPNQIRAAYHHDHTSIRHAEGW